MNENDAKFNFPQKSFTLIELLVVIAVLSLLSSIIIGSLNQARAKSRDSKRVQDLLQVRNALELYRADHGRYPPTFDSPVEVTNMHLDCWDCEADNVFYDVSRLGGVGPLGTGIAPYLNPRPTDPLRPTGGSQTTRALHQRVSFIEATQLV